MKRQGTELEKINAPPPLQYICLAKLVSIIYEVFPQIIIVENILIKTLKRKLYILSISI